MPLQFPPRPAARSSRDPSPVRQPANLNRETTQHTTQSHPQPIPSAPGSNLAVNSQTNDVLPHDLLDYVAANFDALQQSSVDEFDRDADTLHREREEQRQLEEERHALAELQATDPMRMGLEMLVGALNFTQQHINEQNRAQNFGDQPSRNSPANPQTLNTEQRPAAVVPVPQSPGLPNADKEHKQELLDLVNEARQAFEQGSTPGQAPAQHTQEDFANFLALYAPWQEALSRHPAYAAEVQDLHKTFASSNFIRDVEVGAETVMELRHIPPAEEQEASVNIMLAAALDLVRARWRALTSVALQELGVQPH